MSDLQAERRLYSYTSDENVFFAVTFALSFLLGSPCVTRGNFRIVIGFQRSAFSNKIKLATASRKRYYLPDENFVSGKSKALQEKTDG